jgi:hypothetical protein
MYTWRRLVTQWLSLSQRGGPYSGYSDDYVRDAVLMAKTVRVELLGIKMWAVSTPLLFPGTVEPVQVREIHGDRIQTALPTANGTMVTRYQDLCGSCPQTTESCPQ